MTDFTLDPTVWLARQIDIAVADDRLVDATMLSLARGAIETNAVLLNAVRAHRFDTAHLVEKLGSKGYKPRLADQMLYQAVGLDRVADG